MKIAVRRKRGYSYPSIDVAKVYDGGKYALVRETSDFLGSGSGHRWFIIENSTGRDVVAGKSPADAENAFFGKNPSRFGGLSAHDYVEANKPSILAKFKKVNPYPAEKTKARKPIAVREVSVRKGGRWEMKSHEETQGLDKASFEVEQARLEAIANNGWGSGRNDLSGGSAFTKSNFYEGPGLSQPIYTRVTSYVKRKNGAVEKVSEHIEGYGRHITEFKSSGPERPYDELPIPPVIKKRILDKAAAKGRIAIKNGEFVAY